MRAEEPSKATPRSGRTRRPINTDVPDREDRFHLLLDQGRDVVFCYRLQPQSSLEYIGASVTALTGHTPQEFYADPALPGKLIHPDDQEMSASLVRHVRRVEELPEILRWVRKDGTEVWSEQRYTGVCDSSGTLVAVEGIARDITERQRREEALGQNAEDLRRANTELEQHLSQAARDSTEHRREEEALRQNAEWYRSVCDGAPLAFVLWDRAVRVTDWNQQAHVLFGWSREEMLDREFLEVFVPQPGGIQGTTVLDTILRGEVPNRLVHENVTKDGTTLICEWTNSLLHDEHDRVGGGMSLGVDVTKQRHDADDLRRRNAELGELVLQRDALLAAANKALEALRCTALEDRQNATWDVDVARPPRPAWATRFRMTRLLDPVITLGVAITLALAWYVALYK